MFSTYRVTWQIDIYASSARAAAERAQAIQRDPQSIATIFEVHEMEGSKVVNTKKVDLLKSNARRYKE